jgi:hypothetical protein
MTRQKIARLSVVAALMLTSVTAAAQRLFADFSGPWNVSVQGPQGPMNSLLTLKQSGDSISGEFESELGKAPVVGRAIGDTLRFVFTLDAGGQQVNIQAQGVLKDKDNINGNLEVVGMGAGFPFTATKKQ